MSKEKKVKITAIKPTSVAGRVVEAGKTWECDAQEAKDLIAAQKAKPVDLITADDKATIAAFEASLKRKNEAKGFVPTENETGSKTKKKLKIGNSGVGEGNTANEDELKPVDEMTVAELQAELKILEVDFDYRATKPILVELLQAKIDESADSTAA